MTTMHIKNFDEIFRLKGRWDTVVNALLAFKRGAVIDESCHLTVGVDPSRAGHTYRGGRDGLQISFNSRETRELVLRERDAVAKRLSELGVEVEAVE